MDLTTVADDEAVLHDGTTVHRHQGLEADTDHELGGHRFRTLPRPPGERLATVCTVNDVHFGEVRCGVLTGVDDFPVYSTPDGDEPYAEMMSRCAIAEMRAVAPDAAVVKGDLTADGTRAEYQAFLDAYGPAFGERLVHVRGNHDAYRGEDFASRAPLARHLPGVTLAVIDTAVPGRASGAVSADTLEWLDQLAADADRPVLVLGHHNVLDPAAREAQISGPTFGLEHDDAARLMEVVARRARIAGYFAGHTHRNLVQRFPVTGDVPWVEVACVKDFPGAWAEYRVFEGGILQVFRRISAPEALAWSERTRDLYAGLYERYAFGTLADRCFPIATDRA